MDREILFRGKSVDNGKWVYGSLITEEPVNNNIKYYFIRTKYNDEYNAYHQVLVDADTIGQYTGLKDRKGNKIFIGDILEADQEDWDQVGCSYKEVVKWDYELLGEYKDYWIQHCKVTGNKWDNSEF